MVIFLFFFDLLLEVSQMGFIVDAVWVTSGIFCYIKDTDTEQHKDNSVNFQRKVQRTSKLQPPPQKGTNLRTAH